MLYLKFGLYFLVSLITGGFVACDKNPTQAESPIAAADSSGGYTLFAPNDSKSTYLIDTKGNTVHKWTHTRTGVYAVYLLENGHILRTAQASNSIMSGGGSAGYVEETDASGSIVWQFSYSSSTYLAHHDIEPMPNGNVLLIAWEVKSAAEAKAASRKTSSGLWPDHILEVNKSSSQIVWQWHAWDHLIQDYDPTKANYDVVAARVAKAAIFCTVGASQPIMMRREPSTSAWCTVRIGFPPICLVAAISWLSIMSPL